MSPWVMVAQGLWIGSEGRPFAGEFDYALTLSAFPPPTDDGLRHKTLPAPSCPQEVHPVLDDAVGWLSARWGGNNVLVTSSPGWLWAELTVAALYVHLGARPDEAISSLRGVRPEALPQPWPLDLLRAREVGCV